MRKQPTHSELCDLAVRWLKRANSAGGHGCHVAVSEIASGWSGEIPDAIGFRVGAPDSGSVVVEVKVSRQDFKADMQKPHRNGAVVGLGNWRYYMCPEGIIKKSDLPPKYGLLYVNSRGHIKPVLSPFQQTNYFERVEHLNAFKMDSDHEREIFILTRLFSRVGDEEKLNKDLKEARNRASYFAGKYDALKSDHRSMSAELYSLRQKIESMSEV